MRKQQFGISGLLLLLLTACPALILVAQTGADAGPDAKNLNFYTDFIRYKYSDSLAYVEFPVEMYRDQLQFIRKDDQFCAEYLVTVDLMKGDSVIDRKHWRNNTCCASLEEITPSQRLYNKNYFLVPRGDYDIRVEVEDIHSGNTGFRKTRLDVEPFSEGTLRVSDIELASRILPDTSKNVYTKNGFAIYPNPSALYGIGLPVLTGYSEIYNLSQATSDSGRIYRVKYDILNNKNEVVRTQVMNKMKPGSSSVHIIQLNVVSFVSGDYTLVMEVKDMENGARTSAFHKFNIYRQADFEEGGALYNKQEKLPILSGGSELDEMSEEELSKEFEQARYIATSEDRKTFKKANLVGKREFLVQFWNRQTMASATLKEGENFRDDYLTRVEMANQMFKGGFREGWKTDRGRVILVYGKPDDIQRSTFGAGTKSHEIWLYHSLQGGVEFVFVDKQELGDMELVHSTLRGEIYDQDWQRWLE